MQREAHAAAFTFTMPVLAWTDVTVAGMVRNRVPIDTIMRTIIIY